MLPIGSTGEQVAPESWLLGASDWNQWAVMENLHNRLCSAWVKQSMIAYEVKQCQSLPVFLNTCLKLVGSTFFLFVLHILASCYVFSQSFQ